MNDQQLISALIQFIPAPLGAFAVYYLAKSKFAKLDKIDEFTSSISQIYLKLTQIEKENIKMQGDIERLVVSRDDVILLKSEVKAQWKHIDEIKLDLKGIG